MLLMTLFNDLQIGFVVAAADPTTILQLPSKTQWRIYLMQTSDQVHHLNSNEYAVGFIREDYFGREAQSLQSKELMQFHVTYKAKNAVFYSLVPNVFSWSERSNSSVVEPRIEFGSSEASVQLVQEAINGTVWKSVSLVYTATGEQVNRFLCWYPTYTRSKPQYSLFHSLNAATSSELVKLVTPPYDSNKPILENKEWRVNAKNSAISSSTGADFVWSAFRALYSLGAKNVAEKATVYASRDTMMLVMQETVRDSSSYLMKAMNMSDTAERDMVFDFYSGLYDWLRVENRADGSMSMSKSWLTDYRDYMDILVGSDSPIFYHMNGKFYLLNLTAPYVLVESMPMTIPNPNPEHLYEKETIEYSHAHVCLKYGPSLPKRAVITKDLIIVLSVIFGTCFIVSFVSAAGYAIREILRRRRLGKRMDSMRREAHYKVSKKAIPSDDNLKEKLLDLDEMSSEISDDPYPL